MNRKTIAIILAVIMALALELTAVSCESFNTGFNEGIEEAEQSEDADSQDDEAVGHGNDGGSQGAEGGSRIKKNGTYDQKDDVAEYLSIYKKLPKNYITKKEAKRLGWQGGSVEQVAKGKTIGGDRFNNYEKKLPVKKNRQYYECDIDTLGKKKRGSKRIIYSDDGLIYYTGDHYKNFSKMPQSA